MLRIVKAMPPAGNSNAIIATLTGVQGGRGSDERMKTAYLVTGEAGIGKTTLIRQVVSTMRMKASGFYTEDLTSGGKREGFRVVTLDGDIALLASSGHPGPVRVSKYGVDIEELERVGVAALRRALERGHVAVIDEIGKMQLFSRAFRHTVFEAVREERPLLGTIMLGRNPYADRIKAHRNVELLTLTESNRGELLSLLRSHFV
jgi:nucleoside-triphosphatase